MSDPILTTADNIKIGTGLTSVVLAHGACLLSGAYKGCLNAKDIDIYFDIPFRYLWASNIIGTGAGNPLCTKEPEDSALRKTATGAALGAVAAPIEYISGYMVGYLAGFISENVFS